MAVDTAKLTVDAVKLIYIIWTNLDVCTSVGLMVFVYLIWCR